jgi:hypothetical protein
VAEEFAAHEPARGTARQHSRLFAVRLWREELASGPEYRGSVREVVGGPSRNFRQWSDLIAFMVARTEEADGLWANVREGGCDGDGGGDA